MLYCFNSGKAVRVFSSATDYAVARQAQYFFYNDTTPPTGQLPEVHTAVCGSADYMDIGMFTISCAPIQC